MLCSNTFFNRPLNLRLLDIPACLPILEGVSLELQDSNYNLSSLKITSDPKEAFENTDLCIMIGGFPRKDGMERKDLLKINGKIFSSQGEIMD